MSELIDFDDSDIRLLRLGFVARGEIAPLTAEEVRVFGKRRMDMNFLKEIDTGKIKINSGRPVKMGLFLSFLTVKTWRQEGDFSGSDCGWTEIFGDNGLIIRGGIVRDVEYLHSIQYGKNLGNPYNNFVNPFYIFDIMNVAGKRFFLDFYRDDIIGKISEERIKAKRVNDLLRDRITFWENMGMEINESTSY